MQLHYSNLSYIVEFIIVLCEVVMLKIVQFRELDSMEM